MSASGMPLTLSSGRIERVAEGVDSLNVQNVIPSILNADLEVASNGTGELRFATDSTRAVTVDNNQRVGIGVSTTLSARLSIAVADADNIAGLEVEQNDVTNNKPGFILNCNTTPASVAAMELQGSNRNIISLDDGVNNADFNIIQGCTQALPAADRTMGMGTFTYTDNDCVLNIVAEQASVGLGQGKMNLRTDLDITLFSRGGSITVSESGEASLTGFTATSVIGALNELKAAGTVAENTRYTADVDVGSVSQYELVGADATTGNGQVKLSDANGSPKNCVGVSITAGTITQGNEITVASSGKVSVKTSDAGAWTMSQPVYMSQTSGEVTNDVTSFSAGDITQQIGFSIDTSTGTTRTIMLCLGPVVEW